MREEEAGSPWSCWQLCVPTRGSQLEDEGPGPERRKETASSVTGELPIQITPEVDPTSGLALTGLSQLLSLAKPV